MLFQLWQCVECHVERVWGTSLVHDLDNVVFLLCQGNCLHKDGTHKVAEHSFSRYTENVSKGRI